MLLGLAGLAVLLGQAGLPAGKWHPLPSKTWQALLANETCMKLIHQAASAQATVFTWPLSKLRSVDLASFPFLFSAQLALLLLDWPAVVINCDKTLGGDLAQGFRLPCPALIGGIPKLWPAD